MSCKFLIWRHADVFFSFFLLLPRWYPFSDPQGDWGAFVGRRQVPGGVKDPIRTEFRPAALVRLRRRRRKRRLRCKSFVFFCFDDVVVFVFGQYFKLSSQFSTVTGPVSTGRRRRAARLRKRRPVVPSGRRQFRHRLRTDQLARCLHPTLGFRRLDPRDHPQFQDHRIKVWRSILRKTKKKQKNRMEDRVFCKNINVSIQVQ